MLSGLIPRQFKANRYSYCSGTFSKRYTSSGAFALKLDKLLTSNTCFIHENWLEWCVVRLKTGLCKNSIENFKLEKFKLDDIWRILTFRLDHYLCKTIVWGGARRSTLNA